MKLKYKVFMRDNDGRFGHSAGAFASRENAKKAIKKYYAQRKHSNTTIEAWKIVNLETGEMVEQSGRM